MSTLTQPARTSPAATPTRTSPTPAKPATTAPPGRPGPQVYRLLRAGLVIWTLLTTIVCVLGVVMEESNQAAVADSLAAAQDLRDLNVQASKAESDALAYLAAPGDAAWDAYQTSSDQVDQLLLAAAASATDSGTLTGVATTMRQWRDAIAVAHAATTVAPGDVQQVTDSYATMGTALTGAINQSAGSSAAGSSASIIGLVFAILAVVGFIWALVLVARRSHRVLNIGLAVGLVAVVGLVATMGISIGRLGQIAAADSQTSALSQAGADLWNTRSLDALAILQPDNKQSLLDTASRLFGSVNSVVSNDRMTALAQVQTGADSADANLLATLVGNADPWQSAADSIASAISSTRIDPHSLIPDTQWSLGVLSGLCIIAVIATLTGVHTRTKEYR